jgi:hypothetical protein
MLLARFFVLSAHNLWLFLSHHIAWLQRSIIQLIIGPHGNGKADKINDNERGAFHVSSIIPATTMPYRLNHKFNKGFAAIPCEKNFNILMYESSSTCSIWKEPWQCERRCLISRKVSHNTKRRNVIEILLSRSDKMRQFFISRESS